MFNHVISLSFFLFQVSLGPHKVKLDLDALERNLTDYKEDYTKLSKALATLTWTTTQREERSLEGGKNNRFPNAPSKQAATPAKLNTCLGMSFTIYFLCVSCMIFFMPSKS